MKRGFRHANVGLAVGLLVLVSGFSLLHDNEGAMELLGLGSFAVVMAVYFLLVWRDERAPRRSKDPSP